MKLLAISAIIVTMFGVYDVPPEIVRVCPMGYERCSTGFYVGDQIVTSMNAGMSPVFLLRKGNENFPGILKDVKPDSRAIIIEPTRKQTNYERLQICEAGSVRGGEQVTVYGIADEMPVELESTGMVWRIDSEIMFLDAPAPFGFIGGPVVVKTKDIRCIGGIVRGTIGGWTIASVITGSAYLD